jgi:hypothetical protein
MNASRLSQAHREYLLNRHGSLDLDPLPSADDDDPYNWPAWKVRYEHPCILISLTNSSYD